MNLLLLEEDELSSDGTCATVRHRKARHLIDVLRVNPGRSLKVGRVGGALGEGTVTRISEGEVQIAVRLRTAPPEPVPLTLVVALPRPKVLPRLLRGVVALGIKQITFINAYRVDKSYFHSPVLTPERLGEELRLGLEQAGDTILPCVTIETLFRPFVEDRLPEASRGRNKYVAHPAARAAIGAKPPAPAVMVIGPEGGFVDFELDLLYAMGFEGVHLGPRILTSDVAAFLAAGLWVTGARHGAVGNLPS